MKFQGAARLHGIAGYWNASYGARSRGDSGRALPVELRDPVCQRCIRPFLSHTSRCCALLCALTSFVIGGRACAFTVPSSPLLARAARPRELVRVSPPRRASCTTVTMEGLFGNMWEKAMLKIVEVKEKDGARKKLQPCVFCDKGVLKCDGCEGTGKDLALGGKCFVCMGKGTRVCSVCQGVGYVDKVRRGGTDTKGEYLGVDKKAMDPLTPQYAPFILELDEATKYVWCQCGVSMKQVRLSGHVPMIEHACTHMRARAHAHAYTRTRARIQAHASTISCSCACTNLQPFCDGNSHRAYGIKPVAFKTEGEEGKKSKVELCGCKYTSTPPYCDGTHVRLKAEAEAAGTV